MKKLIGNIIRIIIKGYEESDTEGILIDTDCEFDYVQVDNCTVRIIPKTNILYYESNYVPQSSRIIESDEKKQDKIIEIPVFIDGEKICNLNIATEINSDNLLETLYSCDTIKRCLFGKTLKKIEKFDDGVYITVSKTVHEEIPISFNIDNKLLSKQQSLGPSDVVTKLLLKKE